MYVTEEQHKRILDAELDRLRAELGMRPKPAPQPPKPFARLESWERDSVAWKLKCRDVAGAAEELARLNAYVLPSDLDEGTVRELTKVDDPLPGAQFRAEQWDRVRGHHRPINKAATFAEKECVRHCLEALHLASKGPLDHEDGPEQLRNWYSARADALNGLRQHRLCMLPEHAPPQAVRGLKALHRKGLVRFGGWLPKHEWLEVLEAK